MKKKTRKPVAQKLVQRTYRQQFFTALTRRIFRRCGCVEQVEAMGVPVSIPISQFALWEAMREIIAWCASKGVTFFSRDSEYQSLSQPLTPALLEGDLLELTAWYAKINGYSTRMSQPFPVTRYQRELLMEFFYAFCMRVVEGREFGSTLEEFEPERQAPVVETVLRGKTQKECYQAWIQHKDRISVAALEVLDDYLRSLSDRDRENLAVFLDGKIEEHFGYITEALMRSWITQWIGATSGTQPQWLAWPPLFSRSWRQRDAYMPAPTS